MQVKWYVVHALLDLTEMSPEHSQRPTKYCPMLSPECDPRIPRNAITEVCRVHLEDTVSALIQCAHQQLSNFSETTYLSESV